MITVYLDESRHDDPNSYMSLAGFFGRKEQWEALIPDWKAALGKRRSLHMRTLRLNSPTGAKRAKILLLKLGPLPYKHGLTPVFSAVKTGDFIDVVANTPYEYRAPGYVICLISVMQALSKTLPGHESIKIVCEIQKRYEDAALKAFREVTRSGSAPISSPDRPYFSGIEFIPKDSSILTQPSDFLAYAIAQYHEDSKSRKANLCTPILGAPPYNILGRTLEREIIRQMLQNVKNQTNLAG